MVEGEGPLRCMRASVSQVYHAQTGVLRLCISDIMCNENSKTTPRALSYWSSIATGRQKLLVVYQTSYPDLGLLFPACRRVGHDACRFLRGAAHAP